MAAAVAAPAPAVASATTYDAALALVVGATTEANMDASSLGLPLSLGQNHWLRKASGGATEVTWHEMETAIAAAIYFDGDNLAAVQVTKNALSLSTMADVGRAALNKGYMPEDQGGVTEALYHFTAFIREARSRSPADFTVDDPTAFESLPAIPGSRHSAEMQWVYALTYGMCVDDDGDAVTLAAILAVLPGRFNATGRASTEFQYCVSELFQIAKEENTSFASMVTARQAMGVAAEIGSRVPNPCLLLSFPPKKAYAQAQLFRRANFALPKRFLQTWAMAFPHVRLLLTERCSAREAWQFSARLLGAEPSLESLGGLDSKVKRLIASVEGNTDLAPGDIQARVAEMERLLASLGSVRPSTGRSTDEGASAAADDPLDQAKLLAKPLVKQLIGRLDTLNTIPLVTHRVIKELLTSPSCVGWKFLQGAALTHPIFTSIASCKTAIPVQDAFKRVMVTAEDGTIKTDKYYLFNAGKGGVCSLPDQLIKGTFANSTSLVCNFWLEAISPRIQALKGPHCVPAWCDSLAASNPTAMFSNEYMLRVGQRHLVKAFTFIGVPEYGDDTLNALLSSLLEQAERIDSLPDSIQNSYRTLEFAETKEAARDLLRTSAVDAFVQFASEIQIMRNTPALDAERPKDFVPAKGNARSTLSTLDAAIKPMEAELTLHHAMSRRRTQPVQQPSSAAPTAASPSFVPLAALGSSVGSPPTSLPSPHPSPSLAGHAPPPPSSVGPSASEAGVHSPFTSPSAFQYPPGFPPTFPGWAPPPYAPSGVGGFSMPPPPSYAPSCATGFAMPPPPADPARSSTRGSLAHTLQFQGGGVWAPTSQGLRWCGAKHSGATPFDITKACAAAVLPDGMDRQLYCTRHEGCKHQLRHGYTRLLLPKVPSPDELITKKPAAAPAGEPGKKKSRGRGGRGGRGAKAEA